MRKACRLLSWWEQGAVCSVVLLMRQWYLPVVLQRICRRTASKSGFIMLHLCQAQRSTFLEPLSVRTSPPAVQGGGCAQHSCPTCGATLDPLRALPTCQTRTH